MGRSFGSRLGEFKRNIQKNTIGTITKEFDRVRNGPIGQMIHKAGAVNHMLTKMGFGSEKADRAYTKAMQFEGQADKALSSASKIEKTVRSGSAEDRINLGADALMKGASMISNRKK